MKSFSYHENCKTLNFRRKRHRCCLSKKIKHYQVFVVIHTKILDMLLLLFNFFFLLLPVLAVNSDSFFLRDLYPTIVRYSYPLALTTQTCGVYLTVLVSVHRFLGVCHPFRTKRWVTRRPVQYAIISAVVFSIVINIPTWLELEFENCWSKEFNRISRYVCRKIAKKEVNFKLLFFLFLSDYKSLMSRDTLGVGVGIIVNLHMLNSWRILKRGQHIDLFIF